MSTVRDISHHNTIPNYRALCANTQAVQIKITESTAFKDSAAQQHHDSCQGIERAPYHFAQPVSIPQQIAHFLARKAAIGSWERIDMLDCEFAGITGAFVRALKDEYRRQSGMSPVQIYLGLHDVITTCPPSQWWDEDVSMQVARYRKIGAPDNPDAWRTHLGFDHMGLTTYQWDNAIPFYPGGPIGDISYDRVTIGVENGMVELTGTSLAWQEDILRRVQQLTLNGGQPLDRDPTNWRAGGDFTKLQESIVGTKDKGLIKEVNDLAAELAQVKALLTQLVGDGVTISAKGAITVGVTPQ